MSLHYVEDPISGNGYVWFWGFDQAAVDESARSAENRLAVWRMDELLRGGHGRDRAASAVPRAGLGAPEGRDDRFFARISEAITDPDTTVREAGIHATLFSSDRGYRPLPEHVACNDPELRLRNDTQAVLESFDSMEEELGPVAITYEGYETRRGDDGGSADP